MFSFRRKKTKNCRKPKQVLLYGPDAASFPDPTYIISKDFLGRDIVGVLTEKEEENIPEFLSKIPILNGCNGEGLQEVVESYSADEVIVFGEKWTEGLRKCYFAAANLEIEVSYLNFDVCTGVFSLEPFTIEYLFRKTAEVDEKSLLGLLNSKTVLVIGAAKELGNVLCRQIGWFGPKRIVLFDEGEDKLIGVREELRKQYPYTSISPVIGRPYEHKSLENIFNKYKPEIVIYAYGSEKKSEKLKEWLRMYTDEADYYNNYLKDNLLGLINVFQFAEKHKTTKKFMYVSPFFYIDEPRFKAVIRLAEAWVQLKGKSLETGCCVVRPIEALNSKHSNYYSAKKQALMENIVEIPAGNLDSLFLEDIAALLLYCAQMYRDGELLSLSCKKVETVQVVEALIDIENLQGVEIITDFPHPRSLKKYFLFSHLLGGTAPTPVE